MARKRQKKRYILPAFRFQVSAPSDLELRQSAVPMLSCLICVLKAQSWKKACGDTGCTLLAVSSGLSEVVVFGLEMRFPDRRLVGGSPRGNKKVVVGKQELSWNERAWDQRKEAESAVLLQVGMEYLVQSNLSNSCRSRSQQKHFCPTRLDCFYSEVCWSAQTVTLD